MISVPRNFSELCFRTMSPKSEVFWIDAESECKCRQIVRVDFPRAILNSRAVLTTESAASIRAELKLGQFETRFASKTGSRALLY